MRSMRFIHYIAIPTFLTTALFSSQPYYVKSTHSLLMTFHSQAAKVYARVGSGFNHKTSNSGTTRTCGQLSKDG
ncbi:hypothetical protein HD554DRAFT_1071308 [Boletus coccyginus]|nr:hypothetical protein HD554DRAFT_1071308 [Boletus coccyginus]